MIPRPKPRSFKYYLFLVISLFCLLVGLFIYAAQYQTRFFLVISLALVVNIVMLLLFHHRLKAKKSDVKLQREEYFEKANLLKADLEKEWQVIGAFRQKIISYNQLKVLVEKLSVSMSLEDTARALCREVAKLFGHDDSTVAVYVFDQHTGELGITCAERNNKLINIKSKQGDIFDRWVMKTLQPLYLKDTRNDFRFDMDKIDEEEARPIRCLLSVPLMVYNKPVGILRMDSPVPERFSNEDLRFLKTIGDVAAVAVENAFLFDKVEELAIKDGLTGLYLRRYFLERFDEEIGRHTRKDKEMSFVMIDLDHFKKYNDTFGHAAGDIVLKHLADMLCQAFGAPGNLIGRYGGEEFCVLLPECGPKEALEQTERLVKKVEGEEIVLRREKTHITISAGVASFPASARTKEELIDKADRALYQAKHKGRNKVCAL